MHPGICAAVVRASLLLACASSLSSAPGAQLAGEIAAEHRFGQTFVTWREASAPNVRYGVYRSAAPIRSPADLALADFLGFVDDRTSLNTERTTVERKTRTWVLRDGGPALAVNQGVFVYTIAADGLGFYAVTSLQGASENRSVTPGRNATTSAVTELVAPPRPVLQMRDSVREVFGHWVSDRDTPHQPAMSLTPSRAFDFGYERGSGGAPRGLLLRLHANGGNYAAGWPPRALVPPDVDVLALSDLHPAPGFTSWFGTHARFPAEPFVDTRVRAFTQRRMLWALDWMSARLGSALDPQRVSLAGSSLGATGGMYLLNAAPERFAAALLRLGNYDLRTLESEDREPYEQLFGSFELDLATQEGQPILERTRARSMANLDPARDWPVIRTINGRADTRVGWASAVDLFAGLAETFRPAAHYFDGREHVPQGHWAGLERALVQRTCQVRLDRPSLAFTACTLDDDAGDGTSTSGDEIGTIDGYLGYDPTTASASAGELRFDVSLNSQNTLDRAPASTGFAVLTPRRTGPFAPAPGEVIHFRLLEGAQLVDEHWLTADQNGLVHTPLVPLSRTRRSARFERELGMAVHASGLRLGGAPLAGDELQAFLTRQPGERWALILTLESAEGSLVPGGILATSGVLDEHGRADVRCELSAGVPAGTRLSGRVRIGRIWTPASTVTVQSGPGPNTEPGPRALRLAR